MSGPVGCHPIVAAVSDVRALLKGVAGANPTFSPTLISMDEHGRRICAPLVAAWGDFEQGRATLLDLSRLAEQASDALDNASAPLPQLLRDAGGDLEFAHYTSEPEEHRSVGKRIIGSLLPQIQA